MTERQPDIQVRPLAVAEAPAYAALHRRVFSEYNSTQMGDAFCTRFYRQYALRAEAVGFGAWHGEKLLGLVVGCEPNVADHIQRSLFWPSVLATVLRPYLLFRRGWLKRAFSYVQRARRAPGLPAQARPPVTSAAGTLIKLENVGVADEARGLGIGALLVNAFCRESQRRGFCQTELFVVATNHAARRLYEKRGWVVDPNATASTGTVRYTRKLSFP